MEHNFEKKVREYIETHPEIMEGEGPLELFVKHDPWCLLFNNGNTCNCNPIVMETDPDINPNTSMN